MCYINGVKVSLEEFIAYKKEQKRVQELTAAKLFYQPVKRAFDYTEWPIITIDGFGKWDAVPAEWGLIPAWIKNRAEANEFRYKFPTYNAIGHEVFEKRSFAGPVRKTRCLVPSSGFYEFMHLPKTGKKGQPLKATESFPFYITVKNEPVFYMAGFYTEWFDHDKDDYIKTFTICTAGAGKVMAQVHNLKKRQPTILPAHLAERWLDSYLPDNEILEIAAHQFDNSKLHVHTVKQKFWESAEPEEEVHYDNVPEILY
jgi:putative SOS response-associated peptidase YedK